MVQMWLFENFGQGVSGKAGGQLLSFHKQITETRKDNRGSGQTKSFDCRYWDLHEIIEDKNREEAAFFLKDLKTGWKRKKSETSFSCKSALTFSEIRLTFRLSPDVVRDRRWGYGDDPP